MEGVFTPIETQLTGELFWEKIVLILKIYLDKFNCSLNFASVFKSFVNTTIHLI